MKLQKEVAAKYRLITIRPGKHYFPEYGEIDLRVMKLQKADELFAKGFPFLKLREKPLEITEKEETIPEKKKETSKPAANEIPVAKLRENKMLVNKMLTMNWPDLSFNDKAVFNHSQKYFLEKKTFFIANSDMDRKMRSLHAKMKEIDPDPKNNPKRKELIQQLVELEEIKFQNWLKIDSWEEPEQEPEETETEKAVRLALEKEKRIKTNKIYIYRAEKILGQMKEETEKQRLKKAERIAEINKRKQELIDLGSPYE